VVTSTDHDATAKEHHQWGQDSGGFAELVRRFTRPCMTVCDPFAGSGTTLLAAHAMGRHVIGAEIEQEHFKTMEKRLYPHLVKPRDGWVGWGNELGGGS
jgi:adenine-specific DNA-methyltransferase